MLFAYLPCVPCLLLVYCSPRAFRSLSFEHSTPIVGARLCKLQLAQKEVTPPYIPSFDGCDQDITCHFDPQFTREPADLTPDDP